VALFQKEATSGEDPALKAFAQKTLPILQQHLQLAEALNARR
jgi:putative membrane protein